MLRYFAIPPDDYQCTPIRSGHINRSWRVSGSQPEGPEYFLQQLNTDIFPDPAAICANMRTLEGALKRSDTFLEAAALIPTKEGWFHRDNEGNCFRLQEYKTELRGRELPCSNEDIYRAGGAFGEFFRIINENRITSYRTILPGFHNVILRVQQLKAAIRRDRVHRVGECRSLLAKAEDLLERATRIERSNLPVRITHNDTKFNNVLLAPNGTRACVVDLDTVQAGCVHFDFGDGIRTTCTRVAEDALPEAQIPQTERLRAWRTGYLDRAGGLLSATEKDLLPYAGGTLAYLMGIRFLADHLNGDVYYRIREERQNYRRAAAQLALAERLFEMEATSV